ncbi:MAG: 3-oxoadipate enol-lactonase [Actinomycetota bacterium]
MATVHTPTHDLYFTVDGPQEAPVLVLSGSLGSRLEMWDRVLPHLTPARRVVRYDLRGHSRSTTPPGEYSVTDLAEDIAVILDHLEIERADLAGISLGGQTALAFALHHPDRLDRLVVANTGARIGSVETWTERATTVRDQGLEAIADKVIDGWLTPPFAVAHPEIRAGLRESFLATDPEGYAACCMSLAHTDLRPRLAEITAPTLVIASPGDKGTTTEVLRVIADGVPNTTYVEVPGAHLTAVESPGEFAGAVLAHLT